MLAAVTTIATTVAGPVAVGARPPPLLPHWPATYNLSESSVVQPCNYSGLYNFDAYPELAKFGLIDYDCAFTSRMVLMPPRLACQCGDALSAEPCQSS